MKNFWTVILCVFTALYALIFVPVACAVESKKTVRVNGAGMACDQVQLWAEAFSAANPDIPVVVVGSSAGKGFDALFAGNADLALASRLITSGEQEKANAKGMKVESRLIGYAGLAIVTTTQNPINELTLEQLKKIFTGEYANWKELGGPDMPIRCLTRRVPESGGAVFFAKTVLLNQPFGQSSVFTETWGAIMKVCATGKDLPIGIGPRMLAEKSAVKIVSVKKDDQSPGILPTPESMKAKTYPIVVPVHLYWDSRNPDDRILKFVDYCEEKGLGKAGQ